MEAKKKDDQLKKRVMERITKEEIKMKPRWQFLAAVYGMKSLTVLLLLGAALVLTISIYLVEINTPPELFAYGRVGREIFLQDFPYFLVLITVILGAGGGILYSRIGTHYKKTTKTILIMTTLGLLVVAGVLTAARIVFNLDQYLGF
ncbi:hypothetical protein M1116_04305 [Patescibacteria group bacterium]|nr:hypothetical protein [Patescibacteria group bacterium]